MVYVCTGETGVGLPSVEDPDRSMTTYTLPSGSKSIYTDRRQRETPSKSVRNYTAAQRGQLGGAVLEHKHTPAHMQEVIIFTRITLLTSTWVIITIRIIVFITVIPTSTQPLFISAKEKPASVTPTVFKSFPIIFIVPFDDMTDQKWNAWKKTCLVN